VGIFIVNNDDLFDSGRLYQSSIKVTGLSVLSARMYRRPLHTDHIHVAFVSFHAKIY